MKKKKGGKVECTRNKTQHGIWSSFSLSAAAFGGAEGIEGEGRRRVDEGRIFELAVGEEEGEVALKDLLHGQGVLVDEGLFLVEGHGVGEEKTEVLNKLVERLVRRDLLLDHRQVDGLQNDLVVIRVVAARRLDNKELSALSWRITGKVHEFVNKIPDPLHLLDGFCTWDSDSW